MNLRVLTKFQKMFGDSIQYSWVPKHLYPTQKCLQIRKKIITLKPVHEFVRNVHQFDFSHEFKKMFQIRKNVFDFEKYLWLQKNVHKFEFFIISKSVFMISKTIHDCKNYAWIWKMFAKWKIK